MIQLEDVKVLPFCKDCKHLIGVRYNIESADKWKCGHPNNNNGYDLITGIQLFKINLIRSVRNSDMCGVEGKWFELYEPPTRTIQDNKTDFGQDSFSLDNASDARKAADERLAALRNKKKLSSKDLENL